MIKKFFAAFLLTLLSVAPAAASAASYNGTTVQPNSDGQTYAVSANAGDTVNLGNVGGSSGSIAVTFNSGVSGTIKVVPSATVPASATGAPAGNVATYYDVVMNGLSDANISSATWNFGVAKSFVSGAGLSASNVVMYHFVSGKWQTLQTTHGTDDTTNYNFSATTPGFSPFAVAAVSGLSNTGFPVGLTVAISSGLIAAAAGIYVASRKKA